MKKRKMDAAMPTAWEACKQEIIKILEQNISYEAIVNDDGDEVQYEYIDIDVINKIKNL